ncbi:hypothetical protein B0H16DRAFT_1450607 [Mycena metata]|uniref:Uncharacterized protein n=1 Tax=Mycena metata TaxID=1033252 RepID=A0AAD7JXG5_9AGAR|nr:hypothetical protein B0H16DRAFT_1450607 [Mycena metata]
MCEVQYIPTHRPCKNSNFHLKGGTLGAAKSVIGGSNFFLGAAQGASVGAAGGVSRAAIGAANCGGAAIFPHGRGGNLSHGVSMGRQRRHQSLMWILFFFESHRGWTKQDQGVLVFELFVLGGCNLKAEYKRRCLALCSIYSGRLIYLCVSAAGISTPPIQIENKDQIILTADNLPPSGPWLQALKLTLSLRRDIIVDSDSDEFRRKRKRIPGTILDSKSDDGKPRRKRKGL